MFSRLSPTTIHHPPTTICQPRSAIFALFDQVVLLAAGRTAYIGPAEKMLDFFATCGKPAPLHFNPADWALDITSTSSTGTDDDDAEAERATMLLCDECAKLLNHAGPDGEKVPTLV